MLCFSLKYFHSYRLLKTVNKTKQKIMAILDQNTLKKIIFFMFKLWFQTTFKKLLYKRLKWPIVCRKYFTISTSPPDSLHGFDAEKGWRFRCPLKEFLFIVCSVTNVLVNLYDCRDNQICNKVLKSISKESSTFLFLLKGYGLTHCWRLFQLLSLGHRFIELLYKKIPGKCDKLHWIM